MQKLSIIGLALAGLMLTSVADARTRRPPRADLADTVAGQYHGAVMSDARGSSRDNVMVTVTKSGPGQVSVTSSYSRIPPRTFRLQRVMSSIQNVGGSDVFLVERVTTPLKLMLTIDDAAWAGERH